MKRRILSLVARRGEDILFFCGILVFVLPIPTVYFGAMDLWYSQRGETVEGVVLEIRRVSETNYTSETTRSYDLADVELVGTGERIELGNLELYDGIVRVGRVLPIEVAPGGLYRPQLPDDSQYGVWIGTGGFWLLALAVGYPTWKLRKELAERGELDEEPS